MSGVIFVRLHGSLTSPLKIYDHKRKVVFHPSFFRGVVKLGGCKF